MAVEIVPSVLAPTPTLFRQRLRRVEHLGRVVHVDFMDGLFVKQKSISLRAAMRLEAPKKADVHLMVDQPENWLPLLAKWPIRRVIVHCELSQHLRLFLAAGRANRWLIDLAINPKTSTSRLRRWARYVNGFQVMTVDPGRYGAPLVPAMIDRVRRLAKQFPRRPITADGGVTVNTADQLVKAGATRLVVGSYFQRATDQQTSFQELRQSIGR